MPVEEAKAKVVLSRKVAGKRLLFNVGLCFECGACVGVCPHDSLALTALGIQIDHDTCTRCNACVRTCPTGAFQIR
ncbi:MAG: 4Fe-4S binding protein [candidate division Zixibacteria bacterium]|nr:4Fe-4S binding protein [candidate division Zixibacteria bacterium]